MEILVEDIEVYGHHGVAQEEKVLGQRLYFDVRLVVDECPACRTDRVTDTVDYTEVLDLIVEVATVNSFNLLERLAHATAEAILERFRLDAVWVRVRKPHPPVACALSQVGVSLELRRSSS